MLKSAGDKKPLSSAQVYTKLFVRHWDSWVEKEKNGLFYGALKKQNGRQLAKEDARSNHPTGSVRKKRRK